MVRQSLLRGLVVMVALTSCQRDKKPQAPTPTETHFRLFYMSQIGGELEPCGCTLEPLGGLARLTTYLASRKEEGVRPLLVAHGDLRAQGTASAAGLPQLLAAAEFLQKSLMGLGLTVAGDGVADGGLGEGGERLRAMKGYPHIKVGSKRVEAGVQWLRGDAGALAPIAREQPAILLFEGDLAAAKSQAPTLITAGVDLVLLPVGADEGALIDLGGLFALRGGQRGQAVIEANLLWRGDGPMLPHGGAAQRDAELAAMSARIDSLIAQRDKAKVTQKSDALIAARSQQVERAKAARAALLERPLAPPPAAGNVLSARRVVLDSKVAEAEAMNDAVQDHHRRISDLNRREEANRQCPPPPQQGVAMVVGSEACKGCHAKAYAHWKGTPHAKAWATLEARGRTYDYGCVGCHSVGFDRPEGFCRVSEAGHRVNVGCEACHGPGSLHAASGDATKIQRVVDEGVCTGCHHPPHTNTFILSDRLTRIVGAGHGGP